MDEEAFPAVKLARQAAEKGEPYPAIYNAANEVAVDAFVAGRIKFPHIVDTIAEVLENADDFAEAPADVNAVLRTESRARERAEAVVERFAHK